jgi:hypothetical protein
MFTVIIYTRPRFKGPASLIFSRVDIYVDNTHIELSLWDTAGQEEFDRLRSLSYSDTHTIMLCFSVDSRDSLENVESKWVGEIADQCQGVKLVLVALKCDLREAGDGDGPEKNVPGGFIQYPEGLAVAERIKALRYLGRDFRGAGNYCFSRAVFVQSARLTRFGD